MSKQLKVKYIAEALRQFAVATDILNEDPANTRTHDDRNLEAIVSSLEKYGQRTPIIVQQQGMIVRAGNARLAAARSIGWRYIAAVIVDESDVEAATYAITANRTAELSRWDIMVLAGQLEQLVASRTSLKSLGFTPEEAAALRGPPDHAKPAETIEGKTTKPPKNPVTKTGDLWRLGRHRLLCDSSAEDFKRWTRLMQCGDGITNSADAVITDPPYGNGYIGSTADAMTMESADRDGLREFLDRSFVLCKAWTKPGAIWYVFAPQGREFLNFADALEAAGIWQQTLIWHKHAFVLGRCDYHYQHENVMYGWTPGDDKGATSHKRPPPTTDSVLNFDKPQASRDHPTMKPVGMIAELIGRSTDRGGLILDPFLGSGSTLIAADQMDRRCFGMEIDPAYCDVIVRRYQALTGIAGERFNQDDEPQSGIRVT